MCVVCARCAKYVKAPFVPGALRRHVPVSTSGRSDTIMRSVSEDSLSEACEENPGLQNEVIDRPTTKKTATSDG